MNATWWHNSTKNGIIKHHQLHPTVIYQAAYRQATANK